MRSRAQGFVLAMLLVLAVVWVGCGDKGPKVNEEAEAAYAALVEGQTALNDLRQQLAELRAEAKAAIEEGEGEGEGEEGETPEGEEGEAEPSLSEQIQTLERQLLEASETYNQNIALYLNNLDPMLEGEPPSEKQAAVLLMKSAEDMVIAGEYIDQGGDYRRAIRIYEDALQLDPDNEDLQAALAKANEMRYMTEERLATVKKGMNRDEVKELLGAVNLRNIREYPERNVIAWFYPVDDTGKASAVWFRENRSGELTVYKTEFEQIKGREEPAASE